jgi:hypothetical protein
MIQYKLNIQIPGQKYIGKGLLIIHNKVALFYEGEADNNSKLLAKMNLPEILWITSNGIFLKGYKPDGVNKKGIEKFVCQEWFCEFIKE